MRSAIHVAPTTLILVALVASPALAVTEAEVLADAEALLADYELLEDAFEAEIESHAVLKAAYDALELERADVEADRASLPTPCSCTQIDAHLAVVADISDALAAIIDEWGDV